MLSIFLSLIFATGLTAWSSPSPEHPTSVSAQTPKINPTDRTRLIETFRLADRLGDRIWPGWSSAPFAVLLVTPEYEFLIRHPAPSPDFTNLGHDRELGSDVSLSPTHDGAWSPCHVSAIRGSMVSTIVVGQAENTLAKTSTPWVITLLHEHFHQFQDSQPNFYPDVNALNLARGDQTGMWMLSYPFPYERAEVQMQFAKMSELLAAAARKPARPRHGFAIT